MPFDQFTIEQLAGDLLPNRTLDQQVASGLQPLQHHHQRRRRHPGGIPGPLHPRPHRDDVAGLARPDGRLRGLPRPQVRPAHASASSTRWRRSSTTPRRRRWTATSRTRRRSSFVPTPRGPAALGRAAEGACRTSQQQVDGTQAAAARAEFDKWLAGPTPASVAASWSRPTACAFYAPLSEGDGQRSSRDAWTASRGR